MSIILDFDDLKGIFTVYGLETPSMSSMGRFYSYYKVDYPNNPTPPYQYYNSLTKPQVVDFCSSLAGKLEISECFLHLLSGIDKTNKTNDTKKLFENLQSKYPDFYDELTKAMSLGNHFRFIPEFIIKPWVSMTKKLDRNFKGQDIPHFIADTYFMSASTLISHLKVFDRYDNDKIEDIFKQIFKQEMGKNPDVIKACEECMDKMGISYDRKVLPMLEEQEDHLFYYKVSFKSNGIMQQFNVSSSEALDIIKFTTFYLDSFAYYNYQNKRDTNEKEGFFQMSTPYELSRDDAKEKYKEALSVILSTDFINQKNLAKLSMDAYSEELAQELKDQIPAILMSRKLSTELGIKDSGKNKVKI